MNNENITVYACEAENYDALQGYRVDHVYLTSTTNNNWNCFGRGRETARPDYKIELTHGYALWMELVYGVENEGKSGRGENAHPAAGVWNLFSGVCHNAANRLLVLANDNKDVWRANGNGFVTVLFGKYGFEMDAFIASVKNAAKQLEVPAEELANVVDRIRKGQTPEAELEVFRKIYEHRTGSRFDAIGATAIDRITDQWKHFQVRRLEEFRRLAKLVKTEKDQDIRDELQKNLQPDLVEFYRALGGIIGQDTVHKVLQVLPEKMVQALGALAGAGA